MTDPAPEPGNRLHDARDLLHGVVAGVLGQLGWDAERAHRWPPRQTVAPCGWVDVPTVGTVTDGNTTGVAATFPVLFAINGDDQAQVQQQDQLLSYGWDTLNDASTGAQRVRVLTAGPADIDVGGAVLRGVVFSVQVRLLVRTLCPTTLTSDQTP